MIRLRRRGLMMASKSELPPGYTRLAYIESTGTQWIDTGVFVDSPDGLDGTIIKAQYTVIGNNGSICGAVATAGIKPYTNYQVMTSGSGLTLYGFIADISPITVNTVFTLTATRGKATPNCNLCLFAKSQSGNVVNKCSGRIYEAEIRNYGVIVRNFLPCMNPLGEIGLYDLVGKQFYRNAGNGEFVAGPAA